MSYPISSSLPAGSGAPDAPGASAHTGEHAAHFYAQPLHIAFGVDVHYFRGMGVNIASIIANNPGEQLVFHVFSFTVPAAERARVDAMARQYGVAINVHHVDANIFSEFRKFPRFGHYTAAIFTRLIIPQALQGVTSRVLYVDADILCMGSIAELRRIDIDDAILAAALDDVPTIGTRQAADLQLVHKQYFNSGVLYINIDRWIAADVTRQVLYTATNTTLPLSMPDQDALNIVLDGKVILLPEKFNFRYNLIHDGLAGRAQLGNVAGAVFLHFTGRVKPWHDWSLHDARALFLRYQALSPWVDVPLDQPLNHKEMRLKGRFLIKQKQHVQGAFWYLKYLAAKFIALALPPRRKPVAAHREAVHKEGA